MARWQADARGRLAKAAMELYAEDGFDNTTVAEIAARAGLTERTFFRYFADKREVLFGGAHELEDRMAEAVTRAPPAATPLEAVAASLQVAAELLEERRHFARQRQAIILANAELRERELNKLSSLATALGDALRRRRVSDTTATLTGEIAVAVFKTTFQLWVHDSNQRTFPELIRESLDQLTALAHAP